MAVVADINADAAARVAEGIVASGGRSCAMAIDVADPESVRAAMEAAGQKDRDGSTTSSTTRGSSYWAKSATLSLTDCRRLVDINLLGVLYGTTCAYERMLAQGHGHIVKSPRSAD